MPDSYYFFWLITTGQLPRLLMLVVFVSVLVGLFVRGIRSID